MTRLQMFPPMTDAMEALNFLAEHPPHFLLSGLAASMFPQFQNFFRSEGMEILYTNTLGIEELSCIAYKKYPGNAKLFAFLQHLKPFSCLSILTCLICSACLLSILNESARQFFEYLFSLFNTLFSYNMPKLSKRNRFLSMPIIGSWLLMTTIISIVFRNNILEDMVIVIPNIVIDSWEDLYRTPDIRIISESADLLTAYAQQSEDDMAQNFLDRNDCIFIRLILRYRIC